jgi:hypothetical protein
MADPDLSDLRAIEAILGVMKPLDTKDQVRVLTWVIEKLDLSLDMKLAVASARSRYRSYIELAWEKAPHVMDYPSEFITAAAPSSMADRVLSAATFLQMQNDDPDTVVITGKEINTTLRKMGLAVKNVTDCMYTLIRRSPPHMVEAGRAPNRRAWKGYRVTESGIDHVYERIVMHASADKPVGTIRK